MATWVSCVIDLLGWYFEERWLFINSRVPADASDDDGVPARITELLL
jgi:hypothetical protein